MSVAHWQDTISLKTYLRGPDDPNPRFDRGIYPYSMQDDLLHESTTRDYLALHLENEALHLIVLPELGGHLFSAYDKIAGREVFYRNNVVKFGLVARRGAWISGGIEFNFFRRGHTSTTVSPVSWQFGTDETFSDGGASLTISNLELSSQARWAITLSLRRADPRLHQEVFIHNRMPWRQTDYFWANAALPATDDLHLVYPARKARFSSEGIVDYPFWRGRDLSWYRHHDRANDIFALDVTEDFFGCYYAEEDAGLVHFGDRAPSVGKKFFTWGTADDGMIWVDQLTDADGQYVELQSGRFVDQSTYDFMRPFQQARWEEVWWPIHGIGDWVWASDEAALNFRLADGQMQVGAITWRSHPAAEIRVSAEGQTLWERTVSLGPDSPFVGTFPLAPPAEGNELVVTVSEGGEELLRYVHPPAYTRLPSVVVTGERDRPAATPEEECSAEEFCMRGTREELLARLAEARQLYEKALAIDPGYSRAHVGLGVIDYQRGLYREAETHFQQALARDPHDHEARYYLAVAKAALGETEQAREILRRLVALGRQVSEAQAMLERLEMAQTPETSLHHELDQPHLLRDEPEQWLEVATEYGALGDVEKAAALLRSGCEQFETLAGNPMVHYTLAYYLAQLGEAEATVRAEHEQALTCELDYCFPWRLASIPVLETALERKPDDWRASYLLGNLFAARARPDDALRMWQRAADLVVQRRAGYNPAPPNDIAEGNHLDGLYSVLCRNLGYGLWKWCADMDSAAQWYRRAIALRPGDYHVYIELDGLMREAQFDPRQRLQMLRSAPPEVQDKWQVAAHMARALVELEQWDEALEMLEGHSFKPWEGERRMHNIYVEALLGRSRAAVGAGDLQAALADCERALQYPRNLATGRSAQPTEELEVYRQAAEIAARMGDDELERHYLSQAEALEAR